MSRFGCACLLCFYLIIGLNLQASVNAACIDYVVSISGLDGNSFIIGVADETGGWMQVKTSLQNVIPFKSRGFTITDTTRIGVENKSVAVSANDTVTISGRTSFSRFYILPISALGTKYIVSSCHPSKEYTSMLVIATHSQETYLNITFRVEGNVTHDGRTYTDGDTLAVSLGEYQTLTLRSSFDLSGTIVSSTSSVAVFSGTWWDDVCRCQTQLLPVEHCGQEYVVAVDDNRYLYQLQIISEYNDTVIMFNNGSTFTVGDRGVYRRTLKRNEILYFNTTSPVMATLCRGRTSVAAFVVLTPVYSFMKKAVVLPKAGLKKILIEKNTTELDLKLPELGLTIPVEWEDIPSANYKVGTFSSNGIQPYYFSISLNANSSVLVYHGNSIENPGITYYKELESPSHTATSPPPTPSTTTSEAKKTRGKTTARTTDEAETASSRPPTPSTLTTMSEANHTPEKTTTRTTDEAETGSNMLLIIAVVCIIVTMAFVLVVIVLVCCLRRRVVSLEKASTQLQRQYSFDRDQPVSSEHTRVNRTNTANFRDRTNTVTFRERTNTVNSTDSTYLTIQDNYGAEKQGPAH